MTQTFAEILLLVLMVVNAALLTFLAGVLRKVMDEMDAAAFRSFLKSLYRHSSRSFLIHIALSLPFLAAIPYFYVYGFRNGWITAGLTLWLVAGLIAKLIKVPVFKAVAALAEEDVAGLGKERRKLNTGNILQATLDVIAVVFMLMAFVRR